MPALKNYYVDSSSGDDLDSDSDSEVINKIDTWIKRKQIQDFKARLDKLRTLDPDMVSAFALKIIEKFQSRAEKRETRKAESNKADGARRPRRQRGRSSQQYENEFLSGEEERISEIEPGQEEGDEKKLKNWLEILFFRMNREGWGRQILSTQIVNLGKYRMSSKDKDKKKYAQTLALIREILKSSTYLLRTTSLDRNQSLFHEAAENGLCDVIDLCNELILEEAGNDKPGREWVSDLITKEDDEHHSALHLAVQEDVADKGYETVQRLMLLVEPEAIGIQVGDLTVTLTKAIHFGSLKLLHALLRFEEKEEEERRRLEEEEAEAERQSQHEAEKAERERLLDAEVIAGTASGAPAESSNVPVQMFDQIPPELLELAIKENKIDIAKFLVSICPSILKDKKCDFLRCAVEADQEGMVQFLLLNRPELALDPDRPMPILRYLLGSTINTKKIKSHILPVLMRRTPRISLLRKHLGGGSWKEIYLDLMDLKNDPTYLTAFFETVQYEIALKKPQKNPQPLAAGVQKERVVQRLVNNKSQQSGSVDADQLQAPKKRFEEEFESVLKYVAIPLFGNGNVLNRRTEAASILTWLRDCKGVGQIVEVGVEDALHNPNSEEDIENALSGLDIRDLNWRRLDLSIESIVKTAKSIERLHLYSSGNFAAIDHWLGPKGICLLYKTLKQLKITIINDNISADRAQICQTKIDNHFKTVKHAMTLETDIQAWIETHNNTSDNSEYEKAFSKDAPASITRLTNFLKKYQTYQDKDNKPESRTKVAIFDTGVNRNICRGEGHTTVGASFVHEDSTMDDKQRESPWWIAADPHGSQVANIIAQLDPRCDLYIAQISVYKNTISISSVVEAFRWARSNGVQIINCSFALFEQSKDLKAEINHALIEGILVICSTADEGYILQQVWPASYDYDKYSNVFPIAACDSKGKLTGYSSATLARYRMQGEGIDTTDKDATSTVGSGIMSGSSAATAMASGIASLVLSCNDILRRRKGEQISLSRNETVVNSAFQQMTAQGTSEQKPPMILPKKFFPIGEHDIGDSTAFGAWIDEQFKDAIS